MCAWLAYVCLAYLQGLGDKEWCRAELINVTLLGRTDKGFSDSRSVFRALTEALIFYKEKKWGVGRSGGLGLPH